MKLLLKEKLGYLLAIAGIFLIIFAGYWYMVKYQDMSQFIAFACLGFCFIIITILVLEIASLERKLGKFEKEIEYFEDKLLEKFPKLARK